VPSARISTTTSQPIHPVRPRCSSRGRLAMARVLADVWFLASLALAGCTPIVDAKFSEIEITRPDIPVPASVPSAPTSIPFSFSFDSSKLGASQKPEFQQQIAKVQLDGLTLTAKSGISDLSFIQTLRIVAYVPTKVGSLPSEQQVEIADYERRETSPVGAIFSVPLPEPVDLLPLLRPSELELRRIVVQFNVGGQLPTTVWTTDITMSLSVELKE
jgi:hypothetical protein